MRLTYLAPYVPYDGIDHAGGAFFHHYLTALGHQHQVRLIAPGVQTNYAALPRSTAPMEVRLAPLSRLKRSNLGRAAAYPIDLAQGLTIGSIYLGAIRRDPVARALISESDVVEVHWSGCLPLTRWARRLAPRAVLTAVEYDVLYESLTRQATEARSPRTRFEAHATRRRVGRLETQLLNGCDAVFSFSEKDNSTLRHMGVRVPLHTFDPFLVEPDDPPGPSESPTILFVGAFNRSENSDGAHWFLDRVWPAVRSLVPSVRLVIAGSKPPASLLGRASDEVVMTGYVEDLDPLYRAARLAIVPLMTGAGLKFKVPQAMAYGLPVIATNVGAEGIVERSGNDIFAAVSDDPAVWIRTIVRLLNEPRLAATVGERGMNWVKASYNFASRVEGIFELYRSLAHP